MVVVIVVVVVVVVLVAAGSGGTPNGHRLCHGAAVVDAAPRSPHAGQSKSQPLHGLAASTVAEVANSVNTPSRSGPYGDLRGAGLRGGDGAEGLLADPTATVR